MSAHFAHAVAFGAFVCVLLILRIVAVIARARRPSALRTRSCRTMCVLGSGGHTAEILALLTGFDRTRYAPLTFVAASTDQNSIQRALQFDAATLPTASTSDYCNAANPNSAAAATGVSTANSHSHRCSILTVPRARSVGQSWFTTPLSSARALIASFAIVWRTRPDLILCNGPGTCVPLCLSAFALEVLGIGPVCRIVFVESFCRVRDLSLTGKLLYPIASHFTVLWPQLAAKYPRATYLTQIL